MALPSELRSSRKRDHVPQTSKSAVSPVSNRQTARTCSRLLLLRRAVRTWSLHSHGQSGSPALSMPGIDAGSIKTERAGLNSFLHRRCKPLARPAGRFLQLLRILRLLEATTCFGRTKIFAFVLQRFPLFQRLCIGTGRTPRPSPHKT